MALRITPGPLPPNNTRIDIDRVLTAFIQGTTITSFPRESFDSDQVTFVISQTDAPATSTRTRGTLWFSRGEGKLKKWQILPTPEVSFLGVTEQATVQPGEGRWVSISDRRERVVHYNGGVDAGDWLRMTTRVTEWKVLPNTNGTYTLSMMATMPSSLRPIAETHIVDPISVAQTDGSDGHFQVAPEFGFVPANVTGGLAGEPCYLGDFGNNAQARASHLSAATTTNAIVGFVSQSDASTSARVAVVFLKPSISNLVHRNT